jgi:predicted RNA-binding protein Jag
MSKQSSTLSSIEITQYLRDILQKACITVDSIDASLVGHTEHYTIMTPDSSVLIGRDGENIRPLQTLFIELLRKKGLGEKSVSIDINNYLKMKNERFSTDVRNAVEAFIKGPNSTFTFPPMNSYQRMVVHSIVSEYSTVASTSTGEGYERAVVVSK